LYGDDMPFIQTGDVARSGGRIRSYKAMYSDLGVAQSRVFPVGTLCITIAASIAETGLLEFEACFPDSVVGFSPPHEDSAKYVEYFLRTAKDDLSRLAPATAQKNINLAILSEAEIPVPPLNEQKRIVAKIDALTEKSREARQALDEVPALLDQLRQSILAAAFRGDLTKKWREQNPHVEPASALLERIRQERRRKWEESELAKFRAKGKLPPDDKWKSKYVEPAPVDTEGLPELPEGWCWASVEEVATVGTGATPKRGIPKYWNDGTIPWVTSGAVNEELVTEPTEFTTTAALVETNLTLYSSGTLLVAMYGEGKTRGMCSELAIDATTNQALAAIMVHPTPSSLKGTLKRFMQYNYEIIRTAATGGVQPNLNLSHVRRIAVPLPPVAEQAPLHEALDLALGRLADLGKIQEDLLDRQEVLEPSILAKAFRGELVPQDPNDEPASVLLERIRKEREGGAHNKSRKAKG